MVRARVLLCARERNRHEQGEKEERERYVGGRTEEEEEESFQKR